MSLTSYYVLALIYSTHPTSATYPHSSLSILCTHPQNTSSASILHLSFRVSCKKPKTNFNKLWKMSKRSSPQFQLYCDDDCMCTFVRVRRIIIGISVLGSVSQSFSQSGSQPSSHSVTVAIYSFDPVSNSIGLPHPLVPSSPAQRTSTSHASSIWALASEVSIF